MNIKKCKKDFPIATTLRYIHYQQTRQASDRKAMLKFGGFLFSDYPDIPIRFMGFPDNWQDSPLWGGPVAGGGAQP